MSNIYTAIYECKAKDAIGFPEYYDVRLGLPGSLLFSNSDIVIKGTCSRFVVGKNYLITVSECEQY